MQTETGTSLNTPPQAPRPPQPRRPFALLIAVLVVGYAADQLTKAWAAAHLDPLHPRHLVGTILQLQLTRNAGAAFSMATNATWVLTIIASAVIIATIITARRLRSRPWACALGLLLAGALGNLTDRFFRAPGGGRGHVVDFLELPHWPIFNVADVCVVSAACLIALLALLGIGLDGTRQTGTSRHAPSGGDPGEPHAGEPHTGAQRADKDHPEGGAGTPDRGARKDD